MERRNTLLDLSPIKKVTMDRIDISRNSLPNTNNVTQFLCEWITKRGSYAGKLVVKSEWIEFKYISHLMLPD